jgi:hypothetical protein
MKKIKVPAILALMNLPCFTLAGDPAPLENSLYKTGTTTPYTTLSYPSYSVTAGLVGSPSAADVNNMAKDGSDLIGLYQCLR